MPRGGKRPGAGRPKGSTTTELTEQQTIRLTPAQLETWKRAAAAAGLELAVWMRTRLDGRAEVESGDWPPGFE